MPGPGIPLLAAGVGIALRGFGKAIKAYKRANRKKRLGLPAKGFKEKMQSAKKAAAKGRERGRSIRGYKRGMKE
jgi:hypothetical protein